MADDADLAQDHMERQENMRRARTWDIEIPTSDTCLSCGEPTKDGRRWCDADCRLDYEMRKNK